MLGHAHMLVWHRYLPMELLRDDTSCLDKADVFALGATMLELARARPLPSGKAFLLQHAPADGRACMPTPAWAKVKP